MRPWLPTLPLLLLGLLALAALACQEEAGPIPTPTPALTPVATPTPTPAAFPVTVTGSDGAQLTFQEAPQRIVALAPSLVETLFAVGAGEDLVAVDENTNFPPQAADLPKVSGFEPNLEAIAAMEPDLILLAFPNPDLQQSLEQLGIPSLLLATPETVAGVLEQIRLLGRVSGRSAQAQAVIADIESRIEAVTQRLADVQQGPRIFHELDPSLFTTCPGEFIHDMYATLKAQNIATQPGLPCQLSQEALIAADPEVIVLADEPAGVTVDSVKARPGWSNISAVANDRVHIVDPDIFSRPGPRIVEAMERLAELLYPERFP